MIKFIPFHTGEKKSAKEIDFCNSMNYDETALKCSKQECKGIDTTISVNADNAAFFTFKVEDFCCETFKRLLNKFLT